MTRTAASLAAIAGILAVAAFGIVITKLDGIVATQDAVRANQQKTVFPQHEAILSAIREKCK